ncbi:O-antigen ligase family protein [Bacillus marasmi]|uniref:O-antigen ligase family protein n=1 Tax=Bacillus marasmi TaxID=1926279 RepID=UPI001C9CF286|nr:O-antigen ligase family protein [Bacillus marasmi]
MFSVQNILILMMVLFFGFTSLRFGGFGIGEIILLFFCILQLIGQRSIVLSIEKHLFSLFWISYLFVISIGYCVNRFFDINPQFVSFDYQAYIVVLFLCFTFETLFKESSFVHLYSIIRFIYFIGLAMIGVLFILFLEGYRVLFGYYITYAGSDIFSPFANDYHQFAYFVAPLPFIGLYIFTKENNFIIKILAVLGVLLSVDIGLATTSSTLVAAWILALLVLVISMITFGLKRLRDDASLLLVLLCIGSFILLFNYEKIFVIIQDFFYADSNGGSRLTIWTNAMKAWLHSPVFGLGPGSFSGEHVFDGYEAHNTFLQILTQGGVVAGFIYLLFISKLIKMTHVNLFLLCGVISLVAYGFGINDLRRTVLWFYFILFYYLSLKSKGEGS